MEVISVFDGQRSKISSVQRHIRMEKVDYPVFFDGGGRMKKDLGLRAYPTAFLIGRDGNVVWEGMLTSKKSKKTMGDLIRRELDSEPRIR